MVRALEGLGFDIENTAKTAEQVLAVASFFAAGLVTGLLFFVLVRTTDGARIKRYGLAVGGVLGLFSVAVTVVQQVPIRGASLRRRRAASEDRGNSLPDWLRSHTGLFSEYRTIPPIQP